MSAEDTWNTLEKIFKPKSRLKILTLKREFSNIRLQHEEDMSSYIGCMKICAKKLEEAGRKIEPEDLTYSIIAGLPEDYDMVVVQFNTLEDTKFTPEAVSDALITEYERRKACHQESNEIEVLMMKQKGKVSINVDSSKEKPEVCTIFSGKCYTCGKFDNMSWSCPMKKKGKILRNNKVLNKKGLTKPETNLILYV